MGCYNLMACMRRDPAWPEAGGTPPEVLETGFRLVSRVPASKTPENFRVFETENRLVSSRFKWAVWVA